MKEYCVKNMRTKQIVGVFQVKEEAMKEAKKLNTRHQTNEYWTLDWKMATE